MDRSLAPGSGSWSAPLVGHLDLSFTGHFVLHGSAFSLCVHSLDFLSFCLDALDALARSHATFTLRFTAFLHVCALHASLHTLTRTSFAHRTAFTHAHLVTHAHGLRTRSFADLTVCAPHALCTHSGSFSFTPGSRTFTGSRWLRFIFICVRILHILVYSSVSGSFTSWFSRGWFSLSASLDHIFMHTHHTRTPHARYAHLAVLVCALDRITFVLDLSLADRSWISFGSFSLPLSFRHGLPGSCSRAPLNGSRSRMHSLHLAAWFCTSHSLHLFAVHWIVFSSWIADHADHRITCTRISRGSLHCVHILALRLRTRLAHRAPHVCASHRARTVCACSSPRAHSCRAFCTVHNTRSAHASHASWITRQDLVGSRFASGSGSGSRITRTRLHAHRLRTFMDPLCARSFCAFALPSPRTSRGSDRVCVSGSFPWIVYVWFSFTGSGSFFFHSFAHIVHSFLIVVYSLWIALRLLIVFVLRLAFATPLAGSLDHVSARFALVLRSFLRFHADRFGSRFLDLDLRSSFTSLRLHSRSSFSGSDGYNNMDGSYKR